MRRRDLIKVIAGSSTALPLAAYAQQPVTPVIGFLYAAVGASGYHMTGFHMGLPGFEDLH
jgi:hypothetical protein